MFYFTSSHEHTIFLFFTGVHNEDTNNIGMASIQNNLPTLINNIKQIIYFHVNR